MRSLGGGPRGKRGWRAKDFEDPQVLGGHVQMECVGQEPDAPSSRLEGRPPLETFS